MENISKQVQPRDKAIIDQEYTDLCVKLGNVHHAIDLAVAEHSRLHGLVSPLLDKMNALVKEVNALSQAPQLVSEKTS